jgi:ankyrin repeat protein
VERKADLNLVNLNRMSALVLACLHRSHENGNAVAQFLIDAKADLNLRDRSDNSAYTWALKPVDDELCQQSGNDELCQQLVAAGADTRPARGIEVSLPPSDIVSRDEVVVNKIYL